MAPPPQLPEELVEEILVRFPPDEPASLVRAALVCKLWRRIVSSAAFRGAFREFHRAAAPALGMFCQFEEDSDSGDDEAPPRSTARFVPMSFFRPSRAVRRCCRVLDARHGRVLLQNVPPWPPTLPTTTIDLFVWDPISDEHRDLPGLPWPDSDPFPCDWKVAVLCRCCRDHHHHLDCASSSFLVVLVELRKQAMSTFIYSSESGAWAEVVASSTTYHDDLKDKSCIGLWEPGVLVANVLHFNVSQLVDDDSDDALSVVTALRYHLSMQRISTIRLRLPRLARSDAHALVATEGGKLGLAAIDKAKLCLYWPTTRDDDDNAQQLELGSGSGSRSNRELFVLGRVIHLEEVQKTVVHPPDQPCFDLIDFNFADSTQVLFIRTYDGALYSVHMKSGHVKKLPGCYNFCDLVVPYVSLHTPRMYT
ncbi:hypothetical protein BS78_02G014200 [Paspalum vaginatum]|nr:hypothetical protein BS78_02G014200 [Paspalum vaginatum]